VTPPVLVDLYRLAISGCVRWKLADVLCVLVVMLLGRH